VTLKIAWNGGKTMTTAALIHLTIAGLYVVLAFCH
jgi:hypothetical protein